MVTIGRFDGLGNASGEWSGWVRSLNMRVGWGYFRVGLSASMLESDMLHRSTLS
jgi:hypothetical protein